MYKVFLVEDEVLVREAIRDIIDWKGAGFDFVGEAPDGEQALPLIEITKPDILITDIKMPFMNGLVLSKQIKERMPWMKVVILSGHDEFEYTKEAISIDVDEYLLKPASSSDLLDALNKVASVIEKERCEREDYQIAHSKLQNNLEMRRDQFLRDLATGVIPYAKAIKKAGEFQISLSAKYYAAILIKFECKAGNTEDKEYFEYLRAESVVNRLISHNEDVLKYSKNLKEMVCLVKNDEAGELERACYRLVQSIRQALEQETFCLVAASIGSIKSRIQDIAGSLADAETVMNFGNIFSKDKIIEIEDADQSPPGSQRLILLDETKIIEYLRYQDEAYIISKLATCIRNIREQNLSTIFYTQLFVSITVAVVRFIGELGEKAGHIIPELNRIDGMVDDVFTIDGFMRYLATLIERTIAFRESKKGNKYGSVIWKAKYFIDDHYADPGLSLQTVAGHVSMSPGHFSTIFSQELEMTFIEYLTSVRIAKAKEKLLTTNLKSSEIAYLVGYNDHHYFSHVFKKETGLRPTDFRSANIQ